MSQTGYWLWLIFEKQMYLFSLNISSTTGTQTPNLESMWISVWEIYPMKSLRLRLCKIATRDICKKRGPLTQSKNCLHQQAWRPGWSQNTCATSCYTILELPWGTIDSFSWALKRTLGSCQSVKLSSATVLLKCQSSIK